MTNPIAYNIRRLKKLHNMTSRQLAKKLGLSKDTVDSYAIGRLTPKPETLRKIAEVFGVPVEELTKPPDEILRNSYRDYVESTNQLKSAFDKLMTNPGNTAILKEIETIRKEAEQKREFFNNLVSEIIPVKYVPLYESAVPAGHPLELCSDNIISWQPVPQYMDVDCAVRVTGDSLTEAGIGEGDILLVKQTNAANEGDLIIAAIDNGYTVKYLVKNEDTYLLRPANSKYKDIPVKTENARIIGVVKGILKAPPSPPRSKGW